MAVRTISTRLAIEGEAQYRAALSSINSELKVLQSALQLTQNEYAGNANSMAALTAKGEALNSLYEAQSKKVQELQAAFQNAQSAVSAYQQKNDEVKSSIEANTKALSQMNDANKAAGKEWADQAKIVASAEAELKKLQKSSGDTGEAQAKLKTKIEAAKAKMAELETQTGGAAKAAGTLMLENEKLNKELSDNEKYLDAAQRGTNDWEVKMNSAKVELNNLSTEIQKNDKYLDEAAKSSDGCAESIDEFGKETKDSAESVDTLSQALAAAGIAATLKEIADAFGECVDASIAFESAMAGVAKTTDLTESELLAMSDSIKTLSTEIPLAGDELAKITEVAGQLGIEKEDLLSFTEVMANLGVATNMTSEEAATMLAQFTAITGMDMSNIGNMGAAIVALGNNFATNERKITEMSQGIAGAGTNAGIAEADMLALSAAVTSLGIETQAGSTSMSKLIMEMGMAVETGDKLELWARAAGMSAIEFKKLWGEDATAAISAFIGNLNHLDESATIALGNLDISESRMVRMITSLANAEDKTGMLTRALKLSNEAWDENTALVKEATTRYQTTESRLQLLKNNFENVKIAVGDDLTPALGKLYDAGAKILGWIADTIEKCEWLVPAITAVVTALALFVGGLAAYTIVVKLASVATAAFTAIMDANPIFLVITAIVALTAATAALIVLLPNAKAEFNALSASSQQQYLALQQLNEEYEHACEIYGETSHEATALKEKVDEATESFEANKQTAEEVAAAHQAVVEAHDELITSYENLTEKNADQAEANDHLITKLQELMSVEGKTAAVKQEILAIVEALNTALPELGVNYDDYTDSLNLTVSAIRDVAAAEAQRLQNEADWQHLIDLTNEQVKLESNLADAKDEATAAQQRYKEALADYNAEAEVNQSMLDSGASSGIGYGIVMWDVSKALEAAEANQTAANAQLDEAQTLYNENDAAIDALAESVADLGQETQDNMGAASLAAESLAGDLLDLAEAYKAAYDDARESLDGQVGLWQKMDETVATSTETLQTAVDSQITYLQDYKENMESLLARNIEGIQEFAANFTDGSEKSAAALAGLATATDDEIRDIIASMSQVDDYKDDLSTLFATLNTDLQGSLDTLSQSYADTIAEITGSTGTIDFTPFITAVETAFGNVGVTFETAGTDAGGGLAAGIESSTGGVETASTTMAQAIIDAVRNTLDSHSPSQVMHEIGAGVPDGMTEGINETSPDLISTIETMGETIVTDMTTTGTDAVDGFMTEFDEITTETQNILDELKTTIDTSTSGYSGKMESVGAGMVDGMISGLNSRSSSLFSTISGIVNDAIAAARRAADSHSPSKKTEALFEDVGEGMVVGAKNKAGDVAAALQRVVDNALDLDITKDIPNIVDGLDDSMPSLAGLPESTSSDNRKYEGDTIIHMHLEGDMVIREEADINKISEALYDKAKREKRRRGK